MDLVSSFLEGLIAAHPAWAHVLIIVGMLRVGFKPLFALIQSVVDYTADTSDNAKLAAVMNSSVYSVVSYLLDWSASIKLPQPAPAVAPQAPVVP
jgi:hypothetical protein